MPRPYLLALSLLLVGLACQINVGGPAPPGDLIPTSPVSAEELESTWHSVLSLGPEAGDVRLVFSEEQLTSFLAARLKDAEDPLLSRPQVFLREGEIKIYGTAGAGPFEAGTLLGIQPIVDPAGEIEFEVTSVEFGPLPAPEALMVGLSELLTEAFTGNLGSLATGIRVTSLAIADGQVAIVGNLR